MSTMLGMKKVENNGNVKIYRSFFRKTAITVVLLTSVSFNLAFSSDEPSENIEKIYHIYIGDEYIGAVSDEKLIEQTIAEKEQELKQQYSQYEFDGSSNVKVVPEQVFTHQDTDAKTIDKLKEELVIETDAYAVKINNNVVAYVPNEQEFNNALQQLKLQFVSEKELTQYEENIQSGTKTTLSNGKNNIIDLDIQEDISGENDKVEPSKILNANQLINLLKSGSLEKEIYTVKSGDVLSTIAKKYGLKTKELLALNPKLNENSVLQIGQKINVTVEKPLVSVKKVYEKQKVETIPFKEVVKYDKNLLKDEKKVIQKGVAGKKEVSYKITEINGKQVRKDVTSEKIISEAKDKIIVIGTKVIPSRGTGKFAWPTNGGYISSGMGERWGSLHRGIDIARPSNYNIKAADNGTVTFVGWDGTYGNKIVINHNNGYETVYAHLSSINVSVGQTVSRGSLIGIMGSTGNSTGIHLHFEVHKNGSLINPLSVL